MSKIGLFSVFCVLLFLTFSLPSSGQKKTPQSNVKEKMKNGKEDPWADYKEEKDSVSRWAYGINFGGYFPNKYAANYYNGSPLNIDSVNYVMSNTYWYRDIILALGSPDTLILDNVKSYDTNMHYQVAITAGIFLRFNINRKNGIFLEANYAQLKASSVVTMLEIKYTAGFENFLQIPIIGKEERAMLSFGYQRSFPMKSKISFFINTGITMCYTHVKKSVMVVEGKEYNLMNEYGNNGYVPNSNSQTFAINQYGIGFGGMIGGGVNLPLNDKFGLEPGVNMQYYPVNLKGYTAFRPNFSVFIRILLGSSHFKVA
jgi:hypothetical protein